MAANESFRICPKFNKTFSILGRKWNGLILEVLLCEGPQRFKDLSAKVSKCSDRVLVERLRELEKAKLVEKITVSDANHQLYHLTKRGQDLKKVMAAIHSWSDKWYTLEECMEGNQK